MIKIIRNSGWITGTLIFFMPILLIFFLASQAGYSQVKSRFEEYRQIPEITSLAALQEQPNDEVLMLRGQIAPETCQPTPCAPDDLIVYRERPAEGREVRFREEFDDIFYGFVMSLSDGGSVIIVPHGEYEPIILEELHAIPAGDYLLTGFQVGDTVTVQGKWSSEASDVSALIDVTGITGGDKQSLIADWEQSFQQVSWARNILGALTGLGIIFLIIQLRRSRRNNNHEETEEWHPPTTTTKAPPASP